MPLVPSFFDSDRQGQFSLIDLSLACENVPSDFEFIRANLSEEARIDEWMKATAFFHEMRHFHDLVGSVSGISVFLEGTRLVEEIIQALFESKSVILAPVLKTAAGSKAQEIYSEYSDFFSIVLGDKMLPNTVKIRDDFYRKAETFKSNIVGIETAFPCMPLPHRDPFTGTVSERPVIVGLRALMEHTATEMQMFLMAIGAGNDPHTKSDPEGRLRRFMHVHARLFRGGFVPYFILRLWATYHLRGNNPSGPLRYQIYPWNW